MYQVQKVRNIFNSFGKTQLFNWLDGRSYSDAFVICLGAGPWRFDRRKKIQGQALEKLSGRDLLNIENDVNWYPLAWQNNYLNNLSKSLKARNESMDDYCKTLIKLANVTNAGSLALVSLYTGCNILLPKHIKVISLFARDSLKIPSFPMDRHVKKYLLANNLPINEIELVELCFSAGIDPRYFATAIIKHIGNVDNPDWSINV
jgi:hypothetical protein